MYGMINALTHDLDFTQDVLGYKMYDYCIPAPVQYYLGRVCE